MPLLIGNRAHSRPGYASGGCGKREEAETIDDFHELCGGEVRAGPKKHSDGAQEAGDSTRGQDERDRRECLD